MRGLALRQLHGAACHDQGRRKATSAGELAVAAMAIEHSEWQRQAFIADSATRAAAGEWNCWVLSCVHIASDRSRLYVAHRVAKRLRVASGRKSPQDLPFGKPWATVSYDLRISPRRTRRPHSPAGLRAAAGGPVCGRRARKRAPGEPTRGLAAPKGVEGGGPCGRPRRGHPPRLLHRSARPWARFANGWTNRGRRRSPHSKPSSAPLMRRATHAPRNPGMNRTITVAPVRKTVRVNAARRARL